MAQINFPSNPQVNDTFTVGAATYKWDGYSWNAQAQGVPGPTGYTGSQGDIGYTGSQGNIGYTGSQGQQGSQGNIGYTGSQGNIGYTGSQGVINIDDNSTTSLTNTWSANKIFTEIGYIGSALDAIIG